MLTFIVPGEPVAFARAGKNGAQHFTPKRQRDHAAIIKLAAATAMRGRPLLAGALGLTARFYYLRPTSWPKRKQAVRFKTSAPDTDNLCKLLKDALKGVAWGDDAIVSRVVLEKVYGPTARTMVLVEQLEAAS